MMCWCRWLIQVSHMLSLISQHSPSSSVQSLVLPSCSKSFAASLLPSSLWKCQLPVPMCSHISNQCHLQGPSHAHNDSAPLCVLSLHEKLDCLSIVCCSYCHKTNVIAPCTSCPKSCSSLHNQVILHSTTIAPLYSTYVLDKANKGYFLLLQLIAPLPKLKT